MMHFSLEKRSLQCVLGLICEALKARVSTFRLDHVGTPETPPPPTPSMSCVFWKNLSLAPWCVSVLHHPRRCSLPKSLGLIARCVPSVPQAPIWKFHPDISRDFPRRNKPLDTPRFASIKMSILPPFRTTILLLECWVVENEPML